MKRKELTKTQINEIIKQYLSGTIGMKRIGEQFGVSREVIKRVLTENDVKIDKSGGKYLGGKSAADARYRKKTKGKIRKTHALWAKENKEHLREYHKKWREKNRVSLRVKQREYEKMKCDTDFKYNLTKKVRTAVWTVLKESEIPKYSDTFSLLGYTKEELLNYINSQLNNDLTVENYGKVWHLDHIIPHSRFIFNSTDDIEFKRCWSFDNLRPYDKTKNFSDKNKLTNLTFKSFEILNECSINVDISYDDKLLTKEYVKKKLEEYGKEYVKKQIPNIIKFFRKYIPELPLPSHNESVIHITNKIRSEVGNGYDSEGNFRNTVSPIGNAYIKSKSNAFINSSYVNSKTPIKAYLDDRTLTRILEYRLGLNNSGEVFDLSIKQIYAGLSANRNTVSFFKPLVAANIYNHYLGDIKNPTVFDPCFGFGGRLIGFKSIYPNGKYIGTDPSIDVYSEVNELIYDFGYNNVTLFNKKLEDLNTDFDYDIAFTSIPYFDLEKYSDNTEYISYEGWINSFIKKLLSLPRLIVNMDIKTCEALDLTDKIDRYLINTTSHFDKSRKTKKEVILKLNF